MTESATISQLNAFLNLIKEKGIEVRHEILDGKAAGVCELKGRPCLFLDAASSPAEQLEAIRTSFDSLAELY